MSTYILGISAFYHDSAACLIKDGQIIAAAQEERFTRLKHDASFPVHAVHFCLSHAGITAGDLNQVAFYEQPVLKFQRILNTFWQFAPKGLDAFTQAMSAWIPHKLMMTSQIRRRLGYHGPVITPLHHQSHAASAFFPSPYQDAAILTIDGVGEWTTTSIGVGEGRQIRLLKEIRFPHSLGLLYSAFTYYAGFKVNSGEYKLMGLAPYGKPIYADLIKKHLIDIKDDGSFQLNMDYFDFCVGPSMVSSKFCDLFGGKPRVSESPITQRDMDIARSIQAVTEEVMLKMAVFARQLTGKKYLCMAGGVALNCVGNGVILREAGFKDIWIQPAAGDAGGALGAALYAWHQVLGQERKVDNEHDLQAGSYLGPDYAQEIEALVASPGIIAQKYDSDQLPKAVADLIARQNVVGVFHGRMEFGPRALGARSIVGDPRSDAMQSVMNLKIKFRESFRPFAPSVLREEVGSFFNQTQQSPYMLIVSHVHPSKRTLAQSTDSVSGLDLLKVKRSQVPAVTHVDDSARLHTVTRGTNPFFYAVIKEFNRLTGCPMVINTSFNVRGEPIVCTPQDAYRCFMSTQMDYLVLGPYILSRQEQRDQQKYSIDQIVRIMD